MTQAQATREDFLDFYFRQKQHDWHCGALQEIVVEEVGTGGVFYYFAQFTGFCLQMRHDWRRSKVAKRNRFIFDYATIYRKNSGELCLYHVYLGATDYPIVQDLNELQQPCTTTTNTKSNL